MPFTISQEHWDDKTNGFANLIARLRRRISDYEPAMLVVEQENMQNIKKMAIKNSSYTVYKVKEWGKYYPYSLRVNAPPIAPYYANKQSGDMVKSWRVRSVRTPIGITSSIWNEQKYSRFFDGQNTKKMIPRPLLQYILHRSRAPRLQKLHEEHVRFLKSRRSW